ncbi:MAG: hypothetical protein KDK53_14910 [Maritimibacter sp.]|nr:hypothetical protein [Maritimibacter sp.]
MSFRQFQALHDLRAAALHLVNGLNRDPTPTEARVRGALEAIGADRVPDWRLALSDGDRTAVATASCAPEDGRDAFLFATCVRLLDRSGQPGRAGDWDREVDAFSDAYRSAPDAIRAAIFNGLPAGAGRPEDRLTDSRDTVIAALLPLARRLTAEERAEISAADYGCDIARHRAALDALLATTACRFPDHWFPAEVVELTAHVPKAPGFAGCSALVLANAIYDDDHVDHASFRWHQHRHAYPRLKANEAGPLLRGFRYLYEALPDWDPFWDVRRPERMSLDHFLPWSPSGPDAG